MDVRIDADRAFVTIRLSGELTRQRIERAFTEVNRRADCHPGMNRLWDMRTATLSGLSTGDMMSLGRFVRAHAASHSRRVAVLVKREVDFGITRMFEMMTEGQLPVQIRGFRSLESAEAWISKSGSQSREETLQKVPTAV